MKDQEKISKQISEVEQMIKNLNIKAIELDGDLGKDFYESKSTSLKI